VPIIASGGSRIATANNMGQAHLKNDFSRNQKYSPMQACVHATVNNVNCTATI
jgi:hypothetical protein